MQQITHILPRSAWQEIVITENNESLVEVSPSEKLMVGVISKEYSPSFFVRKSVAEKLMCVANSLPSGMHLVLIEGYRSMEHQQRSWDVGIEKRRKEHPELSEAEIERQTALFTARPHPLANHHCGGAVDVILCHDDGTLLDMGSLYPSEITGSLSDEQKKFPMFPNTLFKRRIIKLQTVNRKILRDAMTSAGFVWYPGEWWHYCYGDRMWAVYSKRKECFYGPIEH